jgi:N-acylglucosamine 2-epimerase
MKLWWPHTEAMVAFLYAYRHTQDLKYLRRYFQVTNYALRTFSGAAKGSWYGYCDVQNRVTH